MFVYRHFCCGKILDGWSRYVENRRQEGACYERVEINVQEQSWPDIYYFSFLQNTTHAAKASKWVAGSYKAADKIADILFWTGRECRSCENSSADGYLVIQVMKLQPIRNGKVPSEIPWKRCFGIPSDMYGGPQMGTDYDRAQSHCFTQGYLQRKFDASQRIFISSVTRSSANYEKRLR